MGYYAYVIMCNLHVHAFRCALTCSQQTVKYSSCVKKKKINKKKEILQKEIESNVQSSGTLF